jgi:hypothetical protein
MHFKAESISKKKGVKLVNNFIKVLPHEGEYFVSFVAEGREKSRRKE